MSLEYIKLLRNTVIPENIAVKEQEKKFNLVTNYINKKFPIKLFRFRSCNERNFDALDKDQLWFSSGSTMNDDFDARLSYDMEEIEKQFNVWSQQQVEAIISIKQCPQKAFIHESKSTEPIIKFIIDRLQNMSEYEIRNCSNEAIRWIRKDMKNGFRDVTSKLQDSIHFACFSDKISSDRMWGTYADNATGFAVEYNFKESIYTPLYSKNKEENLANLNLFPISYSNERIDGTNYAIYLYECDSLLRLFKSKNLANLNGIITQVIKSPDLFMPIKTAVVKSEEWMDEREWRAFYLPKNSNAPLGKHIYVSSIKPTGIYLGRKISDINRKIICDIIKAKNIPVYQMKFGNNPKTYDLSFRKI